MIDKKLVSYIKEQLSAGYNINSIRAGLINYGYNAADVEQAIRSIRKRHVSIPVIPVIAGVLILIVIISLFFIFLREKPEKQLLDLKTTASIQSVNPGEVLSFNVELINMGAVKRYDVSLLHEIFDSNDKMITSKQESMAIETRASAINDIMIPLNAKPGRYKSKTTAYYDTKTAESFFMFDIAAAEIIELECPPSCDDFDECTQDLCSADTNYECVHEAVQPCCGNNICEAEEDYTNCPDDCEYVEETTEETSGGRISLNEVITTVREKASRNPVEAESFCADLQKESYKDSCYNGIADITKQSTYCDFISSEGKRDNCYTIFALDGDFSVCEKITNKYLKESCISLSQV